MPIRQAEIAAEESEVGSTNPLPDRIDLSFTSLNMDDLQVGEPALGWKFLQSIPFGIIEQVSVQLDLYEESSNDKMLPVIINGMLKLEGKRYLIRDVSPSLVNHDHINCEQVCVFQRFFAGQNQFELIGSIERSANGPGKKIFIVYDVNNSELRSFESWGTPSFIDLDADGIDEFVIEFEGLHLSLPDISIIRTMHGKLEFCSSIVELLGTSQSYRVKLIMDHKPQKVAISYIESEDLTYYSYTQGILQTEMNSSLENFAANTE